MFQIVVFKVAGFVRNQVCQEHLVVAGKHDVFWLDVTVHHCFLMDLAHTAQDLENQPLLFYKVHFWDLVPEFVV